MVFRLYDYTILGINLTLISCLNFYLFWALKNSRKTANRLYDLVAKKEAEIKLLIGQIDVLQKEALRLKPVTNPWWNPPPITCVKPQAPINFT